MERFETSLSGLINSNLIIKKNKINVIIGPNAGGKSSLIKAILNLPSPIKSQNTLNKKNVFYIPQKINFPLFYTVKDTINLFLKENKFSTNFDDQLLSTLSGGQLALLFLKIAVQSNKNIVIIDEIDAPFSLDNFIKFINLIVKTKKTFILITHKINYIPIFAQEIILVGNKKIIQFTNKEFHKYINEIANLFNINFKIAGYSQLIEMPSNFNLKIDNESFLLKNLKLFFNKEIKQKIITKDSYFQINDKKYFSLADYILR